MLRRTRSFHCPQPSPPVLPPWRWKSALRVSDLPSPLYARSLGEFTRRARKTSLPPCLSESGWVSRWTGCMPNHTIEVLLASPLVVSVMRSRPNESQKTKSCLIRTRVANAKLFATISSHANGSGLAWQAVSRIVPRAKCMDPVNHLGSHSMMFCRSF
jgi:hypothetical protein